jgi:hypothetical protein
MAAHRPALHTWPAAQRIPHPPQWAESVDVFVQLSPHAV